MSSIVLSCSLGDLNVAAMVLRLPVRGNWQALLTIGLSEAPPELDPVTLRITREDGTEDLFVGAVRRSKVIAGADNLSVTIVGGAGLLLAPSLLAQHYSAGASTIPAGDVFAGICDAAGERVAEGAEAEMDAVPLTMWTRVAGPAGEALDTLAGILDRGWRVLADGTIWMGEETWSDVDAETLERGYAATGDPVDGMVLWSTDGAPFYPGTTIDGARAVEVCYRYDADAEERSEGYFMCEVRTQVPGDPVYSPDLTLYRASYAGTVRAQNADGTLAIACDDERIGDSLQDIPARTGWPGCKMTIPEETRVRVKFESADPRGAYAEGINQDEAATKFLALVDDTVLSGSFTAVGVAPGDPIQFVYTQQGSVPGSPSPTVSIAGKITGPGHKYVKGVPGT